MNVEQKAAELMLGEKGARVQVTAPLFLRLLGKRSINIRFGAPSTGTLCRMSRQYLKMGITELDDISLHTAMQIVDKHAVAMSQVVAIAIIDSYWMGWLYRIFAFWLRNHISAKELAFTYYLIAVHGGTEDFINTIKLARETRITKPMMSQTAEGS